MSVIFKSPSFYTPLPSHLAWGQGDCSHGPTPSQKRRVGVGPAGRLMLSLGQDLVDVAKTVGWLT